VALAKIAHRRAIQASLGGMFLALIAMIAAMLNHLTPSEGALLQEVIDLLAIFWALTTLKVRVPNG
jgi:cation transport ATPase